MVGLANTVEYCHSCQSEKTNEQQPLQPRNRSDVVTLDQRRFLSWDTKNLRPYNNIPSGFFRGNFHSRDETTGGERLPIEDRHNKLQRRALKLPRARPLVLRPLRGGKQWSAKQDTWDFCNLQRNPQQKLSTNILQPTDARTSYTSPNPSSTIYREKKTVTLWG